MKRFEHRTVLVTGAGSGIGATCVRRLFAEGASVVAADVRKEDVDKVVSEFGGSDRVYAWSFRLMAVRLRALGHTEVTFVRPVHPGMCRPGAPSCSLRSTRPTRRPGRRKAA